MSVASRRNAPDSRSQWYAQLAALEAAGVAVRQALNIVAATAAPDLVLAIHDAQRGLGRGQPLDQAGRAAKLFLPWEAQLIAAASEAGQLAAAYRRLARHYARLTTRLRQLKARMTLPLAVVVLGCFVTPLPALVRGSLGVAGYLAQALLPIVLALAGFVLLRAAWRRAAAMDRDPPGYGLLRLIPLLGGLMQRQQQCHGLAVLVLLLAGGLPAGRALAITGTTLRDPRMRRGCEHAARDAAVGGTAVNAIASSGLCTEPLGLALIRTGEQAGRLDDCIARVAAELDERLNLQLDLIAEWLPRLFYFGLVVPFLL